MKLSKRTLVTSVATVAALGLFAGACSSSSKSASTTTNPAVTTTTVAAPPLLTITATDYAYSGVPATIPAGIVNVKFINKGTTYHEMEFLKVTDNTNVQALFKGLDTVGNGGAFPASFLAITGVTDTRAGQTTNTQFNLTPGKYLAFCGDTGIAGSTKQGPPHFMRGMDKQITVTGTGGTTLPTAESTLTAHDYGFDTSDLKAGPQTVLFKNIGPVEWHFAAIAEFPKGITVAQVEAVAPKLITSNSAVDGVPQPTEIAQSQAASPGNGNTFNLTLAKGRTYAVVCFFTDKTGGAPHAISHHMYKIFTVS